MQEATVTDILDANAKSGTSAKSGKPWSMSRVGLSNGESVFIFNPIELGQVVEAHQDGEYTNWKPKRVDPKHDEIMKALRAIYKAVTSGEATPAMSEPKPAQTGLEAARAQANKIRQPAKEEPLPEYPEGEQVNLDDIPF